MMIARKSVYWFLGFAFLMLSANSLMAQEEDEEYYEGLLSKEVEVENPIYKPVISLGTGIIHYLGDIRYPGRNPLIGDLGYRLNISTFLGKNNLYRLNFFLLYGNLRGHDFDISRSMQLDPSLLTLDASAIPIYHNSSFQTEFFEFGISAEYRFGHWLGGLHRRFQPFISLGISPLYFNPKGNTIFNGNGSSSYYHFWADGTMRDLSETDPFANTAKIISFDKVWETDLSKANYHDIGRLPQTTVVFPLEAGFDIFLTYRVSLRVASSVHYTLTDLLDNFNSKVAKRYNVKGRAGNDMFMFTNISFNLDLFSDPNVIRVDMFFLDYEGVDYDVMFADQDRDGVFDPIDECPDTPLGVAVDTLGCPFDMDGDGIPDFMDLEPNTPAGAIVDDQGRQISSEVLAQMFEKPTAVRREEAQVIPVAPIWTRSIVFTPGVIPSKFRRIDRDGDGYISFQELLKAIEQFFDGTLDLNIEEIYELNNFFFSQ
jgi:hypothetical protein